MLRYLQPTKHKANCRAAPSVDAIEVQKTDSRHGGRSKKILRTEREVNQKRASESELPTCQFLSDAALLHLNVMNALVKLPGNYIHIIVLNDSI